MPLQAVRALTKPQNGVGAFILQCKRLDFHYSPKAGSSEGMRKFLTERFESFARANPSIHFTVSPRGGKHPILRATYVNGRDRQICVRNMEPEEILNKATILKTASGDRIRKVTKKVISQNESVRGIWDPYHGQQHKI